MTHTAMPPPRLSATASLDEFCDRCGAGARLSVTLCEGGDLAFCGHHANEHAGRIAEVASRILIEEGFAWRGLAALS